MTKRIAALASGQGTLLKALLESGLPVVKMYSDRLCPAYNEVAKGIPSTAFIRSFGNDFDRAKFTRVMVKTMIEDEIDLVLLAGYKTVFTREMFDAFEGRVIGSHPSLLPKFKGPNAVRDALQSGVTTTGTTIYLATEEMDEGRVLAQSTVPIFPEDTVVILHERIKQVERVLFPKVVRELLPTF